MSALYPNVPAVGDAAGFDFAGYDVGDDVLLSFADLTADNSIISGKLFKYIQDQLLWLTPRGSSLRVINKSGGTLNGPVAVTGFDGTSGLLSVSAADDGFPDKSADGFVLAPLLNNAIGELARSGDFNSSVNTIAAAIGDPVYLDAGGALTLTLTPSAVQIVARVKSISATGVLSVFIRPLKPAAIRAILRNSAAQTLVTATLTAATFDTTVEDNDVMAGVANKLIVKTAGLYEILASGNWTGNATGARELWVYVNGTGNDWARTFAMAPTDTGTVFTQRVSVIQTLAVNDEITLHAQQNSGAGLDFNNARLSAVRIGG